MSEEMIRTTIAALMLTTLPAYAIEKCNSSKRYTCVVDGDTFWLEGEKIRMIGYDTPEPQTNICGGEGEKALAGRATQRVMQLLSTGNVSVQREGADRYGRTLAHVFVNGENIGDILIREGLARSWPDGCEFWCGACDNS